MTVVLKDLDIQEEYQIEKATLSSLKLILEPHLHKKEDEEAENRCICIIKDNKRRYHSSFRYGLNLVNIINSFILNSRQEIIDDDLSLYERHYPKIEIVTKTEELKDKIIILDYPKTEKAWKRIYGYSFNFSVTQVVQTKCLVDELTFSEEFNTDLYNTGSIMTGGYPLGKLGFHKFKTDNVDIFSYNYDMMEFFVEKLLDDNIKFETEFSIDYGHNFIKIYSFIIESKEKEKFIVKFHQIHNPKGDDNVGSDEAYVNRYQTIKFIESYCDINVSMFCYTGIELCVPYSAFIDFNSECWSYYRVMNEDRIKKYNDRGYDLAKDSE